MKVEKLYEDFRNLVTLQDHYDWHVLHKEVSRNGHAHEVALTDFDESDFKDEFDYQDAANALAEKWELVTEPHDAVFLNNNQTDKYLGYIAQGAYEGTTSYVVYHLHRNGAGELVVFAAPDERHIRNGTLIIRSFFKTTASDYISIYEGRSNAFGHFNKKIYGSGNMGEFREEFPQVQKS